jgi:hypothetical protein
VDRLLFTKSLDIVGACTTEVVEIKYRVEYPTDYFSMIIAAQIISSGNFFPPQLGGQLRCCPPH